MASWGGEGEAAAGGLVEEGDLFLQLSAAAEADAAGERQQQQTSPRQQQRAAAPPGAPGGASQALQQLPGAGGAGPCAAPVPPGVIPVTSLAATALPPPRLLQPGQLGSSGGGGAVVAFGAAAAAQQGAGPAARVAAGGFSDVGQGSLVERYSGLKIRNPRVSHTQLRTHLGELSVLRLSQVRSRHRSSGLGGGWATICVLGEKSKPRETAAGRAFSIWKVTDLDQTCVSLFLFGRAHEELCKEQEGTLLALMSTKVREEGGEFSLSADGAEAVWVLGQSPEFGHCKANKKNGEPCRVPVNLSRCPYCPFHIQSEFNRLAPRQRTEFQGSALTTAFRQQQGAGRGKGLQWRPGQFEPAAKQVQPGMRALPTAALHGAAARAAERGSSVGHRYLSTAADPQSATHRQQQLETAALRRSSAAVAGGAAALAPLPPGRTGGVVVMQLPQKRKAEGSAAAGAGKRAAAGAAAGQAAAAAAGNRRGMHPAGGAGGSRTAGGSTVMLLDDDDELFTGAGGSSGGGSGGAGVGDAARQRATELLRLAGGALAPDPNATRRVLPGTKEELQRMQATRLEEQQQVVVQQEGDRAAAEENSRGCATGQAAGPAGPGAAGRRAALAETVPRQPQAAGQSAAAAAAGAKRQGGGVAGGGSGGVAPPSAMEAAFGAVLAAADGGSQQGTRYKALVEDEEHDRLDKVMTALERKDEMAQRMDSITRLAVQAFHCKACGYTAEKRRPECAAHTHAVGRVEATKRWWQCDGCKYRFATVAVKYPRICRKCNLPETGFTAVSMYKPQSQPKEAERQESGLAQRSNLLARGAEQKWVNGW